MRRGFPGWRACGQVFLLGAVMSLGLAPFGLWPVAFLALVGVFHSLTQADRARADQAQGNAAQGGALRAAWLGWFAGAGYFGAGLNWIVEPFMVDAAKYGWMAPFALVLMAFGLGLFWAAAAGSARLFARPGLGLVVTWSAAELARGYVLTGFPWALVGHMWLDTPVAQMAGLIGANGLTWLTLLAAGLAVGWRKWGMAAGAALLGAAFAFGFWVLAQPDPVTPGVTLRLVQPNAAQDAKWDPDHAQIFYNRLMQATAAPQTPGMAKVDLVIWPETALPYLVEDTPDLPAMISAAANGVPVAVGLQRVERSGPEVRGFNSLRIYGAGGALLAAYDKHHLVPFGEYIPLGDLLFDWFGIRAFAAQTGNAYSAGPGPKVLDLGGKLGTVLPLICYEAVFPQDLRGTARADWILQITNDAWFGTLTGPFQHADQARLRASEQGLPLVRVANTGVTEVVDARGRVTAALPFGTEGRLDAALPGKLGPPPYASWGEIPVLLLLAGCALLAIRRQSAPTA